MAYGTAAGVTLLIGKADSVTFTNDNITAAIAMADTLVDSINSGADDANKTLASNIIAANILLKGRANYQLKGLASDGGMDGRAAKTESMRKLVPTEAFLALRAEKPVPKFKQRTPDALGDV